MENQNESRNLDLEQSFPVEKSTRPSKARTGNNKSWEEFCKNSPNMTDEERQREFVKHVVGNPFAKKVIGKGGPDKNATYIGILATIFGMLGIHDLNCGNIRNGILKLIFTCFGITSIISFCWTMADLINLGNGTYKAANGIPLGKAPWCKIVALVEILIFAAIILGIIYVLSQFIVATAFYMTRPQ